MSTIDELEAQFRTAQAAAEAYSTEITEKYRQEFPRPEGETGLIDPQLTLQRARAWTDAEREHLDGLRRAATQAAVALHRAKQQPEGHTSGD